MDRPLIRRLDPSEADRYRDALIALLVDAVESGGSVNFVWPMTREKSADWWADAFAAHGRGERIILIAERKGQIDGTVHLVPAPMENQPFRADVSKMLVHRRARRQGLGAVLLAAVEAEARAIGRTLLTLDTETGGAGDRLYARGGWTKFGEVPGYAFDGRGETRIAASFFYKEL